MKNIISIVSLALSLHLYASDDLVNNALVILEGKSITCRDFSYENQAETESSDIYGKTTSLEIAFERVSDALKIKMAMHYEKFELGSTAKQSATFGIDDTNTSGKTIKLNLFQGLNEFRLIVSKDTNEINRVVLKKIHRNFPRIFPKTVLTCTT